MDAELDARIREMQERVHTANLPNEQWNAFRASIADLIETEEEILLQATPEQCPLITASIAALREIQRVAIARTTGLSLN